VVGSSCNGVLGSTVGEGPSGEDEICIRYVQVELNILFVKNTIEGLLALGEGEDKMVKW